MFIHPVTIKVKVVPKLKQHTIKMSVTSGITPHILIPIQGAVSFTLLSPAEQAPGLIWTQRLQRVPCGKSNPACPAHSHTHLNATLALGLKKSYTTLPAPEFGSLPTGIMYLNTDECRRLQV
jgi:hypothetical protein